jgi:hypothetical protein
LIISNFGVIARKYYSIEGRLKYLHDVSGQKR